VSIALRGLHRDVRAAAEFSLEWAQHFGIRPQVTSTTRSWAAQRRLRDKFESCVAAGRFPSAPDCRFPANKPGDSAHQFGLAWDSVVPAHQQATWDAIRRRVGFGVPPNDLIHAEVRGWRRFVFN